LDGFFCICFLIEYIFKQDLNASVLLIHNLLQCILNMKYSLITVLLILGVWHANVQCIGIRNDYSFNYTVDKDTIINISQQLDDLCIEFLDSSRMKNGLLFDMRYKMEEYLYEYKRVAFCGGWSKIEKGRVLKYGMFDGRIPALRNRLFISNDIHSKDVIVPELFDGILEKAIIQFQERHGLVPDGIVDEKTIDALNIPALEKLETLEKNLRWWERFSNIDNDYYILINIAAFKLYVVKNNTIVKTHKVIVGKPYRKTPIISGVIEYIVFNPTWTVPPVMLKWDIMPLIKRDSMYLKERKIHVLTINEELVNHDTINWNHESVYSYIYRQEPYDENAFGKVKFVFPNNRHVFLHDTPDKELFDKQERAFSAGCIRINKPLELAVCLLNDSINWNMGKIRRILRINNTYEVMLETKPNIYIRYFTSWIDENGLLNFRKDIYEEE